MASAFDTDLQTEILDVFAEYGEAATFTDKATITAKTITVVLRRRTANREHTGRSEKRPQLASVMILRDASNADYGGVDAVVRGDKLVADGVTYIANGEYRRRTAAHGTWMFEADERAAQGRERLR